MLNYYEREGEHNKYKVNEETLRANRGTSGIGARKWLQLKFDTRLPASRLHSSNSLLQRIGLHGFRVQRARQQFECPLWRNYGAHFRSGGEHHPVPLLVTNQAGQKEVLRELVRGIAAARHSHVERRIWMPFPWRQSALLARCFTFSHCFGAEGVIDDRAETGGVTLFNVVVEHPVLEETGKAAFQVRRGDAFCRVREDRLHLAVPPY